VTLPDVGDALSFPTPDTKQVMLLLRADARVMTGHGRAPASWKLMMAHYNVHDDILDEL
jgi:hypothetical protein